MVIRNLIFDWSGTLVDDLPAVWKASNFVFQKAGVPELTLDEFRAEFCLPFDRFYDRFVPHVPLPELEVWFHNHFFQVQDSVRELPHAREFLEFCQSNGARMFILSTVRKDHFKLQAEQTGFIRYFEGIYVQVFDKRKVILELLDAHGLKTSETLFIGDMQHDVESAHHGGVHSCAVLTGYNRREQLEASQPDLILRHLAELKTELERNQFFWNPRSHGQNTHF